MEIKKKIRNICIISDSYIPQKLSAAGMIYNLSKEFSERSIDVTCVCSGDIDAKTKKQYSCDNITFITTNIFRTLRNKSLVFRFIFEIATSIVLALKCFLYFKNKKQIELIVWYGPSVFLWFVVWTLNFSKKIPVYYILRDIFPDWLITLRVVKNPIIIWLLRLLSNPQYNVSDIIGVETFENVLYLKKKLINNNRIELLFNWPNIVLTSKNKLDTVVKNNFSKLVKSNNQKNIKNFIYLGNSSIAHDYESMIVFLNSNIIDNNSEFNVHIYGKNNKLNKLHNTNFKQTFWGLVPEYNIPFILSKVDCGIVSLNRNSITHNIPGKFISYIQFGLPIICFSSIESSLAKIILEYKCGVVIDLNQNFENNIKILSHFLNKLDENKMKFSKNSLKLFNEKFDIKFVVDQIIDGFCKI